MRNERGDARIIMNGAVSGETSSQNQNPFRCRGTRFSSRVRRCGSGDAHAEGGYTSGIWWHAPEKNEKAWCQRL